MRTSDKALSLSIASLMSVAMACSSLLPPAPAPTQVVPSEPPPVAQATNTPAAPAAQPPATDTPAPTPEPSSTSTPAATATPAMPFVSPLGAEDIACRYGPDDDYSVDGGLKVGERVPVTGRDSLTGWLQIENPRRERKFCWVSVSQVKIEGDPSQASVLPAPSSIVAVVSVSLKPGTLKAPGCTFPVTFDVSFSISTTGPTNVTFFREKSDGSKASKETVEFKTSGTKSFSDSYKVGEQGDYWFSVNVTAPNAITGRGEGTVDC